MNFPKTLAFVGCLCIAIGAGCRDVSESIEVSNSTTPPAATPAAEVELLIDFGDRSMWIYRHEGGDVETVAELMSAAAAHPRAPEITMSGSGVTAFVSSIGGLDTTAGKGWTFYVNDKWSEIGIGNKKIAPGDRVKWTYGSWEDGSSDAIGSQ